MSQPPIQSDALGALRVQIDALDKQLLSLLNQRAHVAEQVGEIKRAEGSPFFRPDRVAQVIDKITKPTPARSKTNTSPPSGAKSCQPAWRLRPHSAWPCWARRARFANKQPSSFLAAPPT
jgi:chorismate mutase